MKVVETSLPSIVMIEPDRFHDARGFFVETWNGDRYAEVGIPGPFVQDNLSYSHYGVLRGLHFQNPKSQGKLVSVLQGQVFDVAVDVRQGSPTFGQWVGCTLSEENGHQLWIPAGFAHGYCVTSEVALFSYKCTDYYSPANEATVLWSDPAIGIDWPLKDIRVSAKDARAPTLADFDPERLPLWPG